MSRDTVVTEALLEARWAQTMDTLHRQLFDAMDAAGIPEAEMAQVVKNALGVQASEEFEEWAAG